ncbi:MAG: SagB/ThcOx family dehydrogenase [Prevotellaceae bacterium]|jgi:nitroreductase|nr:SagB/ThcOx family dehydrogenase [Prevotellaceae bacterium]
MKKYLFIATIFMSITLSAQDISLPAPVKKGGMPLMEALNNRMTTREFSPEALDNQTLSDLLWAAWGFNRENKRTAPSAMDRQELSVYVILKQGVYLYDAKANKLVLVNKGDFRKAAGQQDFVAAAPLNLVFVEDTTKQGWAERNVGFLSQNVYLYCASKNLGTVVRGMFDAKELTNVLKLKDTQKPILTQTVGKKK